MIGYGFVETEKRYAKKGGGITLVSIQNTSLLADSAVHAVWVRCGGLAQSSSHCA
jgi:hypothetical protein